MASGDAAAATSPPSRPSRERKAVDRYMEQTPPRKSPSSKLIAVEQGPGEKLRDIPNVFYKLSKRKTDDNLQLLHTILFGKKSSVHFLKRNIFQFSGFVWADNEEKQKMRVKEKLDKCNKDKLVDFCDLLDIQFLRATTKKEELREKILHFLESPCATRDVVLAEKEKKGKRKRTKGSGQSSSGGVSSERESKKHKSHPETEVKKRRTQSTNAKDEEGDNADKENVDGGASSDNNDLPNTGQDDSDTEEENDHSENDTQDEGDEPEETVTDPKKASEKHKSAEPKIKEKDLPVKKDSHAKSVKSHSKPVPKKVFLDAEDVPDGPTPSKRYSLKGQTSRISRPITKETMTDPKKSSEKQKGADPKVKGKALPVKKDSHAKSVKSSAKPVPKNVSIDVEDVHDESKPSKRDSLKGQANRISKSSTKEKSAAINKDSLKSPKNKSKSSSTKTSVDERDSVPPSSSKPKKENKKKDQCIDSSLPKDNKAVKKQATKQATKLSTKEQGKRSASGNVIVGPTAEELRSVLSDILREVDFHTVTLADILNQLGDYFNVDLMNRKGEVKQLIEDVINNMTDDEDGEEDEDGDSDDAQ